MGPYIQDQNGSSDFHALEQFSPSVTTTTPTAYRTGWLAAGPKQNGSSDFHALEYFFPSVTTTTPTAHSTGWLAAGPKKGGGVEPAGAAQHQQASSADPKYANTCIPVCCVFFR